MTLSTELGATTAYEVGLERGATRPLNRLIGIAFILSIFSAVFFVSQASAEDGSEAEGVLNRAVSEFRAQNSESDWISETVAVEQISNFVLGSYVRHITNADHERFQLAYSEALTRMILQHSARLNITEFGITATHSRNAKDKILTSRVVTGSGETEQIKWRLRQTPQGWKIVDIEAFGIWLVVEQRAQMRALIEQSHGDFDTVIERVCQTFQ